MAEQHPLTDATRDLIQRLTRKLDHLNRLYNVPNQSALIDEAHSYLAQPEPEELMDEEIADEARTIGRFRAVIAADRARWGRPTTTQESNQ